MRRKMHYIQKILTLSPAYLRGTAKDTSNWKKYIFFKFKTNQEMF